MGDRIEGWRRVRLGEVADAGQQGLPRGHAAEGIRELERAVAGEGLFSGGGDAAAVRGQLRARVDTFLRKARDREKRERNGEGEPSRQRSIFGASRIARVHGLRMLLGSRCAASPHFSICSSAQGLALHSPTRFLTCFPPMSRRNPKVGFVSLGCPSATFCILPKLGVSGGAARASSVQLHPFQHAGSSGGA